MICWSFIIILFQLFQNEKYEEAALHAATSPKVIKSWYFFHTVRPGYYYAWLGCIENPGHSLQVQVVCSSAVWTEIASAQLLCSSRPVCPCIPTNFIGRVPFVCPVYPGKWYVIMPRVYTLNLAFMFVAVVDLKFTIRIWLTMVSSCRAP